MYADDYYNDDNGYVNNDDYLNKRFVILIIAILKNIFTKNYYFKSFRLFFLYLLYFQFLLFIHRFQHEHLHNHFHNHINNYIYYLFSIFIFV